MTPGKIGPATGTLPSAVLVSTKTGKVGLGTFTCSNASTCTVTVRGTFKIGGKTYRVSKTFRIAKGKSAKLSLTLSKAARKALAAAGDGELTVKVSAVNRAGASGTTTEKIDISTT